MTPCRDSEALDIMGAGLTLYLHVFGAQTGLSPDKVRELARTALDRMDVSRSDHDSSGQR